MSTIKTVALAGASGNLGPSILTALLDAGIFEVTILTRQGSTATFPAGVRVIPVDYNSLESLTNAMKDQDAVVSTLGMLAMESQTRMIDAATAAGVKRFIPSEFGSDTCNQKARPLPVFATKVKIQEYLAKNAKESNLTYTPIINAGFFDWGLGMKLFVDFKEQKASLYDGGDRPVSVTRLSAIGDAVVGVLKHPEETKNRAVYVQEAVITQNQLVKIAEEVAPEKKWETKVVDTEKLEKDAYAKLAGPKDKQSPYLIYDFLYRALFAEGYGGDITAKVDNELLGVKMMSDEEVKALVASYVVK